VIPAVKWSAIGPELILTVTAMVLLLFSVFFKKESRNLIPPLCLIGVLLALVFSVSLWGRAEYAFQGMIVLDNYSLFFKIVFLVTTALTLLMSIRYLKQEGFDHGEYYILLLFAAVGMMLMASAADLIIVFLGLETFSLAIYVLAGFSAPRRNPTSQP
jgi:NADH-quinone oxidoreductase subunit N